MARRQLRRPVPARRRGELAATRSLATARSCTINGALAVDLYGQVVADRVGGQQFSGIGGHEDFVAVSGLQLEDRSLVCLPSTATTGDAAISRIVAAVPAGDHVTTPRHQIDVVVTEYGVAEMRGRTVASGPWHSPRSPIPTSATSSAAAAADYR